MGVMTVAALIERASIIIQDTTNVRWPKEELLKWLNDGQREIVLHKPVAYPQDSVETLAAGTKQSIPATGISLIDVPRNEVGDKRAIRIVEREILEAERPGWHNETAVQEVKHYVFDTRNPKKFFVYPPNDGTGQVNLIYSAAPTDLALGTEESPVTITLDDIYSNALLDYIIYRASIKDAEYAVNAQRAEAMYQTFLNSLGIHRERVMMNNPNLHTRSNISRNE